jgi:GNAT superfamily N-acetyltransferase
VPPIAPTGQIARPDALDRETTAPHTIDATFSLNIHPSPEDWNTVEEWMIAEGYDPGCGDAQAVATLDSSALVIGMLGQEPVSAISLVRVSENYAFLGNHIVREGYRGRGLGVATRRSALPHAGTRVIGLEAVPEQVKTYERAGFTASHSTVGYHGCISYGRRRSDPHVKALEPGDLAAVAALDALCSPHGRTGLLAAWFAAPATTTVVYRDRGEVTGFGAVRPSRSGHRIGPLIANTPQIALALYDALTAAHPGDPVHLNCPAPNTAGSDLAHQRGLIRTSHTVRMYSRPVRPSAMARCYSIASLAWG